MHVAIAIAWLLAAYGAAGVIFGLIFISQGIEHVDSQARNATWGFRLIILPGVAALWPLLLMRLIKGASR